MIKILFLISIFTILSTIHSQSCSQVVQSCYDGSCAYKGQCDYDKFYKKCLCWKDFKPGNNDL